MSRVLFNARDEITKKYNPFFHRGVDIVKYKGKVTEVISHSEGKVVDVNSNNKYGNYVKLKHNNGMYTLYAHLSKINVNKNDFVKRGKVIGTMGKCKNSKSFHLHFEVRNKKDRRINPTKYLDSDLPNNKEKNSIHYQVYDNKKQKWLKSVFEVYDYVGNIGNPIGAVCMNLELGNIKYRVHELGAGWTPFVNNSDNYAGDIGSNIDGVQINSDNVKIIYRVHLLDGEWMEWDDKEHIYNRVIDGIQIRIVED